MPYIKNDRRSIEGAEATAYGIDMWFENLQAEGGLGAGDLNYILSMIIHKYTITKKLSYQTTADISAAMTGALHEYERNVVDPYEDKKKNENGHLSQLDNPNRST